MTTSIPSIGTKFTFSGTQKETFEIYNTIESGYCAVLLNSKGEKRSPNAKTLKFVDAPFWEKAIAAGFIKVVEG